MVAVRGGWGVGVIVGMGVSRFFSRFFLFLGFLWEVVFCSFFSWLRFVDFVVGFGVLIFMCFSRVFFVFYFWVGVSFGRFCFLCILVGIV